MENNKQSRQVEYMLYGTFGLGVVAVVLLGALIMKRPSYYDKDYQHTNVVKAIYKDGVLVQDVEDKKERILSMSLFRDSAKYVRPNDTIWVYHGESNVYSERSLLKEGVVLVRRDSSVARREREKFEQFMKRQKVR